MSAPTPPAPLPPGTVIAGLTIEESGTIMWQWVTFFIVGNVFAGFWLVLALLNAHPEIAFQVTCLLARLGLGSKHGTRRHHHARPLGADDGGSKQLQLHESVPVAAAASVPPLTLPTQGSGPGKGSSAAAHTPTAAAAGELGSPLRSHRSRPLPPPELVVEQTISPRTSFTPRLSEGAALTPRNSAAVPMSPSVAGSRPGASGDGSTAAAPVITGGAVAASSASSSSLFTSESSQDGQELPLVTLEWRNLCYAVKGAHGPRLIVQGIYGCANAQELQGLMGPSGAGKSTLMDLLSKRTDPTPPAGSSSSMQQQPQPQQQQQQHVGTRSSDGASSSLGESSASADAAVVHVPALTADSDGLAAADGSQLLVNGAPIGRKAFMRISAYVPQHDNLVPTMTAIEALSFYASIILPPETTQHTKRARIARVLAMMGLTHQGHTLVGGMLPGGILLRGLSGGEKKRLAIACGVVAGPSLVFLDEPTSGLDSFAALNVVLFLKSMATQGGATLVASLHQPRSAIWGQLDQVTLLASGRLMYTGPTDGLVPWFTSLGYAYSPSTHGMASDWALDLVSLGFTKPQSETRQAGGSGHEDDTAATHAADMPAAAAAAGGMRQRGANRQPQQQAQQQQSVSMMSSRQELNDAAAAFLQHLRGLQPGWFQPQQPAAAAGAGRAASSKAPGSGGAAAAAGANGLPAIKVAGSDSIRAAGGQADDQVADVRGTVAALGTDTAASPFLQQDKYDTGVQAGQQQQRQRQLASLDLEQEQAHGVWHSVHGAWRKYKALLWRELLITTRNPADVGGRMMTFTYVSLLSGLIAWNLPGGADSIMNRISVAYAVLSFYLLMPFVFMSLFTSDKRFFAADTTARLYHPSQYYAAKVTVTLPFNMLIAVIFHLIYYGMTGMRHGTVPMAQSCVISLLMGVTAMQAVYCCAIVASSQDLAFVYAIAWTALNLLVNPYMALFNLYSLGWGFSWLRYLSPYNFAWQALVQIELKDRGFDCGSGSGLRVLGLIPDLLPQGPSFSMVRTNLANLAAISTNRQCVASGNAVITMYTSGLSFGAVVGILLGYFVLFMGVTYAVVWRSSKRRGPTL